MAIVAAALAFAVGQGIPLLSQVKVRASQHAVDRGDGSAAIEDALDARKLQPWAASPYLQLALVQEQTSRLPAARRSIQKAIDRDPTDWRLWLVEARVETKLGRIRSARKSLARAKALNPRSPLFDSL